MATEKKYLDYAGLHLYDEQIKKWLGASIGNISVADEEEHEGGFVQKITQANGVVTPVYGTYVSEISTNADSTIAPSTVAVKTYVDDKIAAAVDEVTLEGADAIEVSNNTIKLAIDAADKVLTQGENGLLANIKLAWDGDNNKLQILGKKDGENNVVVSELDASHFVVDGMLDGVAFSTTEGHEDELIFTWNTAAGKMDVAIDLGKYLNEEALADINASIVDLKTADTSIWKEIGVKHVDAAEGVEEVAATGIYKYVDEAVAAAAAAAAAAHNKVAIDNVSYTTDHLTFETAEDASGATTYTIGLKDVASDASLAALEASVGTVADASNLETVHGRIAKVEAELNEKISEFTPITNASIYELFGETEPQA